MVADSWLLIAFLSLSLPASADVPHLIRYQGVLTDSAGQPVENPNAILTFRLYEVAIGGTPLWEERHEGVVVANGAFSVLLGNGSPTPTPLDSSLFEKTVWLTLVLEGETEMSPRQQITSVPTALRAESAERIEQAARFDTDTTGTLTEGLVAYWKLDESSGARADAVGTNTLTDHNTVTQAVGKVGQAAQFVAADSEYLSVADNAELSTGDIDFSLAAWVYLDSLTATRPIVTRFTLSNREYALGFHVSLSTFFFEVYDAGGASVGLVRADDIGTPVPATWYFIVAWHDAVANTVNIQVNNGAIQSTATSGVITDQTIPTALGTTNDGGSLFDGRIDEVGFWKRVLTDQERADLYNAGSGNTYHPAITSAGPWTQNGSDIFYTGGNVGIGTTDPDTKLEVRDGEISLSSTGTGEVRQVGTPDDNGLQFYTNNDVKVTILSGGNVGIGTQTPTTTLDVAGPIKASGTGGNVPHACHVVIVGFQALSGAARCPAGEVLVGGGGSCGSSTTEWYNLQISVPDTTYNEWYVQCSGFNVSATNYVHAVCCPQ